MSALDGFKPVDSIPVRSNGRTPWAVKALQEFLAGDDAIIACEYEDAKKAQNKQVALRRALKGEQFQGKANVQRRDNVVYLEKL